MDIVCLGELLIDLFPAEVGRRLAEVSAFVPKPGGAPANVAVAAARLGHRAAFIGKVGDDAFGHYLASVLEAERVDTRGLRFDREARTTLAFIARPDANTSEFVFYRNPGADMRLEPSDLDRDLLVGARAFHFGSLSLTAEPVRSAALQAASAARAAGALVSFDANYRPDLWPDAGQARERMVEAMALCDVLKVNEAELALLSGWPPGDLAGACDLLAHGPAVCLVTLGPRGSYFCTATEEALAPGFAVNVVDTTGCGDAFVAGVLSQLVAGGSWQAQLSAPRLREILRYANAVAALTAQIQGVIPALPTAAQVEALLASNPDR